MSPFYHGSIKHDEVSQVPQLIPQCVDLREPLLFNYQLNES